MNAAARVAPVGKKWCRTVETTFCQNVSRVDPSLVIRTTTADPTSNGTPVRPVGKTGLGCYADTT